MSRRLPKSIRVALKALVRAHVAKTLPVYLASIGQPDVESARKLHAAMHVESFSELPWQLHAHPARVLYQSIAELVGDAMVDRDDEDARDAEEPHPGTRALRLIPPFRHALIAEAIRVVLKRDAFTVPTEDDTDVRVGAYASDEARLEVEHALDEHEAQRSAKRRRTGGKRRAPGTASDDELSDADSLDARSACEE